MSRPCSTSRRLTFLPSGPVWCVTSCMPRIFCAVSRAAARALGDLHAAALAAAAGVDLRLDDDDLVAGLGDQLLRGRLGLVEAERRLPLGHRHAVLREDLLALILVDLHGASSELLDGVDELANAVGATSRASPSPRR